MVPFNGVHLIAEERMRQQEKYPEDHDDKHEYGWLGRLASSYISFAWSGMWHRNDVKKPKDDKDALVKAGALVAAEIDRLERAQ